MILIREALVNEIPAMREVAIASYVEKFAPFNTEANMNAFLQETYSLDNLTKEFYQKDSLLLLAFFEGKVVGFVRLRVSDEVNQYLGTNHVELQRLYVHPDFQNRKIGKLLMERALAYAFDKQVDWMWLGVWEKNEDAQRFYRGWGFEKFSEHVFQMGDDPQIDWLLKKKIS